MVEDNLVNQLVARRLLEKKGHLATVASNGVEALKALERESFDLVLMDVQMPEMGSRSNGIASSTNSCSFVFA